VCKTFPDFHKFPSTGFTLTFVYSLSQFFSDTAARFHLNSHLYYCFLVTHTLDALKDYSGRAISPSQMPLPTQDNTTCKHKRQTSMCWAGFELAIPETKRPQTYSPYTALIHFCSYDMWSFVWGTAKFVDINVFRLKLYFKGRIDLSSRPVHFDMWSL
jgi:hypothetical protein